jgi:hypothetical protein
LLAVLKRPLAPLALDNAHFVTQRMMA